MAETDGDLNAASEAGLSRADMRLLDDHARNFRRLQHLVLDSYTVQEDRVIRTEGRLKSHSSVLRHLDDGESVRDLVDLTGLRIVTVYQDSVEDYSQELRARFTNAYVKPQDKGNGYRTTKVVITIDERDASKFRLAIEEPPLVLEVQIRSAMDHLWAALDREYMYNRRQADEALVQQFRILSVHGKAFDEHLLVVRKTAENERNRGADAIRVPGELVPISAETLEGAIRSGGPATKFDETMSRRRNTQPPRQVKLSSLVMAAGLLQQLGHTDLASTLGELNSDGAFGSWLEIYDTRDLAQAGKRPVHVGDTLALYPQYLACQQGQETLLKVFRAIGVDKPEMPRRLFETVQVPFLTATK